MKREHDDVTADLLRSAMRRFASGVTILTISDGERDAGLTVSSFTSISLEPPIVMVAVNATGSAGDILNGARSLAIHILGAEHEDLSVRFSSSSDWEEKIRNIEYRRSPGGAVILEDVPTVIEATVRSQVLVGTHHVTFGDVTGVLLGEPAPTSPLLYFDRDYRRVDSGDESA